MKRIAVFVLLAMAMFAGNCMAGEKFPLTGWTSWGEMTTSEDATNETVVFSGKFNSTAGWVVEKKGGLPFAGKVLKLTISGSGNCVLDHQKLFKLEANGAPCPPRKSLGLLSMMPNT